MKLGETIARIRRRRGLLQTELAERSGISATYLSQIENDKKDPTLSVLRAISAELDVPLPIIFFTALERRDVPAEKREVFDMLQAPVNAMITELFMDEPVHTDG